MHPEGITWEDKKLVDDLNYDGIEFPVWEKDFSKIGNKNKICINECCYENKLTFSVYRSDQNFENLMDLLLVIYENKSHYVYIKDFNRFMFHKTKNKNKKYFCKSRFQCFTSKNVLTEHKKVCSSINGAQSVWLEKGKIEFKKYFKQVPVPFKIDADFECNLKSVKSYESFYAKKYQDHVPCSFTYKLVCVDNEFTKPIVVLEAKMLLMNLLKQFLKSMDTVKK